MTADTRRSRSARRAVAACVLGALVLGACGGSDGGSATAGPTTKVAVVNRDDACELSAAEAPAGRVEFAVDNKGSKETEFYVLDDTGKTVAEVEHIGPGLQRTLRVKLAAGAYLAACKPGEQGDGIRTPFVVSG